MADLFDYLYWRADLTLQQDPLNEVDAVILARLAYLPVEHLEQRTWTVEEASVALLMEPDLSRTVLNKEDQYLLSSLARSRRFAQMRLHDCVSRLDEQTQFSAITADLGDGRQFVLFRGTDNTLVGWREDFNMSFTSPVPAQIQAADYLERIAAGTQGELLLGGHSKGGNLAVYAGAFCSDAVRSRISHVYNLDGPGFPAQILQTPGYQQICGRVSTYVPQSSVVGMLLEHEEAYTIVHSSESINLMQHDTYSWEVERNHFSYVETVTDGSRFVDATVKDWVASLEPDQREKFVDAVYQVLSATNAQTLRQLRENWLENSVVILRALHNLDEETRTMMVRTLQALTQSTKTELYEVLRDKPARLLLRQSKSE